MEQRTSRRSPPKNQELEETTVRKPTERAHLYSAPSWQAGIINVKNCQVECGAQSIDGRVIVRRVGIEPT